MESSLNIQSLSRLDATDPAVSRLPFSEDEVSFVSNLLSDVWFLTQPPIAWNRTQRTPFYWVHPMTSLALTGSIWAKFGFMGKDLQFTSRIIAKDVSFLMLKKCTPMGRKRESISVRGWMKKIGQFKLFVKSEELPQEDRRNRFNKWRLIVLLLILMNRSGQDITEDRWKRALGPEDKQGPQQGLVDWMQWQWASAPILILIVWCDTARTWKCNMVLHKQDPWHVGPLRGLPAHIWLVSVWFSPVEPT